MRSTTLPIILFIISASLPSLASAVAPVANVDIFSLEENQSFTLAATNGLLANDTDADGDALSVSTVLYQPAHGSLTWASDGSLTYIPQSGFYGTDSFYYRANDGTSDSTPALVIFSVRPLQAVGVPGSWTTFGNGPSHTGFQSGFVGNDTPSFIWDKPVPNNSGINQVVVAENHLFVTPIVRFSPTYILALNARTGAEVWQYNFDQAYSINPPTFDGANVYVQRGNHGGDSHLWSFNAFTGSVNWQSPFGAQWERYYAPTIADGKIWVNGGPYGGIYGFDQASGNQLFFNSIGDQISEWTPLYHNGRLYSWIGGVFREYHPTTGVVLNSLFVGSGITFSQNAIAVADQGIAYFQGNTTLTAIDLTTFSILWQNPVPHKGTPAVSNGVVYVSENNIVNAYESLTGDLISTFTATENILNYSQPIITDDRLIVASANQSFIFDRFTNTLLHTIPEGGKLSLADDILYIAGTSAVSAWLVFQTIRPNDEAPVVENTIGDYILDQGASNVTIDLLNVFTDPDNDDSTMYFFVASNTDSNVVSTSIVNNELILDFANFPGETEITVRANSGGQVVDVTFLVRLENPNIKIELFDANGASVLPGQTVSGIITGNVTIINKIGEHAQFYQNFRTFNPNEPGYMIGRNSWQRTFRIDTTTFYDGENLISVHVHPHNHEGHPYIATFEVGLLKIITANNNPSPSGDTKLPSIDIDGDRIVLASAFSIPGHTISTLRNAVIINDDVSPIDIDHSSVISDEAQVISHLGASVLGRFRWITVTPPFGDSRQRMFTDVHLINFQKQQPFEATIVFFFNDSSGRANYGFHSFTMPALSAEDRAAYPLPALDAKMLNVHQGNEIIIPQDGSFTLQVEVKNSQVLGPIFPRLSTWIGNRSVAVTDLSSLIANQSSFVVDVEIPATEIQKLQASRDGGQDSVAFAIWNDFTQSENNSLPVSEHSHLSLIRTSDLNWSYGDDVDLDGINNSGDNCPDLANLSQIDSDRDGLGDECDSDANGDGIPDSPDEVNIAPTISLLSSQSITPVTTVYADAGNVNLSAMVFDPNNNDTHAYNWISANPNLVPLGGSSSDATFSFDPSLLPSGLQKLELTVTDNGTGLLSDSEYLVLRVDPFSPVLLSDNDTDGDGIADADEGLRDSDMDRIVNYLDWANIPNQLPSNGTRAVVQSTSGSHLILGETTFASAHTSALVTVQDLQNYRNFNGESPEYALDSGFEHPTGIFDFEVRGIQPGTSTNVVVPLNTAIPAQASNRVYSFGSGWSEFIEDPVNALYSAPGSLGVCPEPGNSAYSPGLTTGHYCIQLTLADGGPNDSDSENNGIIKYTGGLAIEFIPVPIINLTNTSLDSFQFNLGDGEQVVLKFSLNNDSNDAEFHGLTISAAGTANETTDIGVVSLYLDENNNDIAEANEKIATGNYLTDNGQLSFELASPRLLSMGETKFLVSYQF